VDCDDLQDGLAVLETMRKSGRIRLWRLPFLMARVHKKRFTWVRISCCKNLCHKNAMGCPTAAINYPLELPATLSFSKGNDLKATMTT